MMGIIVVNGGSDPDVEVIVGTVVGLAKGIETCLVSSVCVVASVTVVSGSAVELGDKVSDFFMIESTTFELDDVLDTVVLVLVPFDTLT